MGQYRPPWQIKKSSLKKRPKVATIMESSEQCEELGQALKAGHLVHPRWQRDQGAWHQSPTVGVEVQERWRLSPWAL